MGQGASTAGSVEGSDQAALDTPAVKDKGLSPWKKIAGRASRSSAGSRSSCSSQQKSDDSARIPLSSSGCTLSSGDGSQDLSATGVAQPGSVASTPAPPATQPAKQQQILQQGSPLPPRPPLSQTQSFGSGNDNSSNDSKIGKHARLSGSMDGNPVLAHLLGPGPASGQPPRPTPGRSSIGEQAQRSKQQTAAAGTYSGSRAGSVASAGSCDGATNSSSRASFSKDADPERSKGAVATGKLSQEGHGLHPHNLLRHNQQHGSARASIDSCTSKTSSAVRSVRSSFAAEVTGPEDLAELDRYGRPSFAAFEPALKTGRGAVFEASLPADLADMYRRLAVLLPQAPIPLVTVLQLWGVTDPMEAQEAVQIFAMQGVLKVATLPDGATWLMVSPEHQQFLLADHPESVKQWHQDTINIYKRQVIAMRYMQQQQQGLGVSAVPLQLEDVQPSQLLNDGYIWLALTHHLLGAGQLSQVRALLTDPAWLEVKLHCYGVAAVVDDFRNYLQVEPALAVKAVLQAFQMSLSCCMERSHLPMMQHQLVLRLMAAAKAAAASAEAAAGSSTAAVVGGSLKRNSSAGSTKSLARTASSESEDALQQRQQTQYKQFQQVWFAQQYARCRAGASLLGPSAAVPLPCGGDQQVQQQQLPPHLMGYTPSLRQAGGMQRMALRGHLGPIRKVVITPDGKDILTASDDGTVQVWDMDIGDCIMQLRLPDSPQGAPHPGSPLGMTAATTPLTTLAVTGDGGCCLCGDAQGWLSCWNLKTGQLVQRLRAHRGRLNAIALDSSGSRCITAGEDALAKLWSVPAATPSMNRSMGGPGGFAGGDSGAAGSLIGSLQLEFEMAGHGLEHLGTGAVLDVALSSGGVLGATVSNDMKAKVWDLDQQQCVQTVRGHTGWIVSVRFVGSTHNLVTASHDTTARVWDAWTGECLATLIGHTGRLNSVSCSSDGRTIVTCSDDMTARVWETSAYTCIGMLSGHSGWINDVAIRGSSSKAVTISGDATARVWDIKTGKCLQVLQGHSDDVTCVVLTSRGRFVVTGSVDGTAQVWDLASQDIYPVDVHDGKVISVVTCPAGSHAASIGADGCLRLWDLATGACVSSRAGHVASVPQTLLITAGGDKAYSSAGNRELIAWDLVTGAPSVCLPAQQGSRTKCTHVSADGSTAVVLLFDSSMAVYDTGTGQVRCHLMQRGDRDVHRVHSGGVNAVILTADGSKAVSVSKDTTARVWDTVSGACTLVLQGHEDSVHAAVVSSDECLLATASFDCTVRLWDFTTGDCLKVLQHTDPVMRAAFSPLGRGSARLVTACEGRALWLWDVDSGACLAALGEHKESVTSVAFSSDGAWLASTSQDRSVLVWESGSGRLAGLYVGDAAMLCCSFAVRGAGKGPHQLQPADAVEQQQGGAAAAADALVAPKPVGVTLVVGDASGHVHFLDCL